MPPAWSGCDHGRCPRTVALGKPFVMLSNGMQAVFAGDEKGPASMSVVIADRSRLSWLALRRRFNNLRARLKVHPVAGLFNWVGPAERLVIAPQELRTADPTRAAETVRLGRDARNDRVSRSRVGRAGSRRPQAL